jgi:hypothetical protein
MSALCQSRPNAPQQKKHRYSMTSSAISEQRRRHSKAQRPGAAAMSFEGTKDPLAEGVRHY